MLINAKFGGDKQIAVWYVVVFSVVVNCRTEKLQTKVWKFPLPRQKLSSCFSAITFFSSPKIQFLRWVYNVFLFEQDFFQIHIAQRVPNAIGICSFFRKKSAICSFKCCYNSTRCAAAKLRMATPMFLVFEGASGKAGNRNTEQEREQEQEQELEPEKEPEWEEKPI